MSPQLDHADGPLENGHAENGGAKAGSGNDSAEKQRHRLPLREWVAEKFTWSWFTCTQSTGGIAAVLSDCPKQFDGLETIGIIIFIFNIVLFFIFTALQILRWKSKPATLRKSFINPPECYFFGSFWLTLATMIINTQRYGVPHAGPWLIVAVRVMFWIYAAISLLTTTLNFTLVMKYTPVRVLEFQPPMFILIFNAMLTGTVAAVVAADQPPPQRVPIMVAGVAFQGLGWIVCLLLLAYFVASLLERGWGPPDLRPGLFITIGTAGFTIVALIGLARAAPADYGYFAAHPTAAEVLQIVALWAGIFMWLFACWLFGVAMFINVLEVLVRTDDGRLGPRMHFTNSWWAFIFPNVGWTLSTIYIGQDLESEGILWFSVAMVILLVLFWLIDLFLMAEHILKSFLVDSRVKVS